MEVRISYALEFEKVPEAIDESLSRCIEHLNESVQKCSLASDLLKHVEHHETTLQILDEARRKMAISDRILLDSYSILEGYVSAKNAPSEPKEEPPNVD